MEVTVLENRKIRVEPIIRKRAFFPSGHDGEHTYTGCHKDYGLPFDTKRRCFVNPFFNDTEQIQFEKLLDQKPGALNLYKLDSEFWGEFSLSLTKDGVVLDLNNPVDALWYRVLKVNPRFANNDSQKSNAKCDYILVDEKLRESAKTELSKTKESAIEEFMKIRKSKLKMYETLRLLNKKIDKDADSDVMRQKLLEIIDEPASNKTVTNISDFIRVINDPLAGLRLFILDAVDAGEILFNSTEGYKIKDTGVLIGKHIEQAIDYFNTKNADTLEVKAIIEQRLK